MVFTSGNQLNTALRSSFALVLRWRWRDSNTVITVGRSCLVRLRTFNLNTNISQPSLPILAFNTSDTNNNLVIHPHLSGDLR
jgi:hypothetical protein